MTTLLWKFLMIQLKFVLRVRKVLLRLIQRWNWFYNPVTVGAWVKPFGSDKWKYEVLQDRWRLRKFHIGGEPGFNGEVKHVAAWWCHLSPMQIRALKQGVSPMMIQEDKLILYFPMDGLVVDSENYFTEETIH